MVMRARLVAIFVVLGPGAGCGSDGDPDCVKRGTPADGHLHLDGEGSHAGRSCIAAMCHASGQLGAMAPAYVVAGTVYKRDRLTIQAGVTVRLEAFSGSTIATLVTDADGNFYLRAQNAPSGLFPSIPSVSVCPSTERMLEGATDPSFGNCNESGCHGRIGTGPGPIFID